MTARSQGRQWVGLDVGTQGCRAIVVDDSGHVLASARHALSGHRSGAMHEQDPMSWIRACTDVLRRVHDDVGPAPVAGLAICGTSGSFVVCDSAGTPLTPAVMYDDSRATGRVADNVAQIWSDCADRNGYRIQPTWAVVKLVSMISSDVALGRGRLTHVPDFIGWYLAGHRVPSDTSHALKSGYDLVEGCWPKDLFEQAGVDPGMLPDVVHPGELVGTVTSSAASATGIPAGTPIIAGMTDGCASQIAAGAVRPGDWNLNLGTTFVLKGVSENLLRDPDGAVYSHRGFGGWWLPGGASNCGAGVISSEFGARPASQWDKTAGGLLPAQAVRYPLPGRGERFPFVRPDAQGFTMGSPGSEAESFAAILQGVAYVERLSMSRVAMLGADISGRLSLSGGGARSALWNQLIADVLGRPASVARHPDAAFGMAVLAAGSLSSTPQAADSMIERGETIEPDLTRSRQYMDGYLEMVDELQRRDYISAELADIARGDLPGGRPDRATSTGRGADFE